MPRTRVAPRTVLVIASIGSAVAFIDVTIVNIAFPAIARSFPGSPVSTLSWVLNAYNVVFAAFLIAAGRIGDLVGRRRVFVVGLELFTLGSLLCALAPDPGVLIGCRVVQALGAACLVPSGLAIVLHAFPVERRSHGVALLSAVAAASAGLGPALGGLLVSAWSWRLVFLVNLPIGLGAIVLARRRLVESRNPGRRRLPDLVGACLLAASVATIVMGVVQGQAWGWGSPRILGCFAAGLALGAMFLWRCRHHRAPIIDLTMLTRRSVAVSNSMTVISAAGFYGYTLCNVLFLTGVWHYSVLKAGLALTPGPLVAAAVAGPVSRIGQRVGHRAVLVAGGLVWGGAILWLVERVGMRPDFAGQWLPGILLLGVGAGILFPNLSAAAVASAPEEAFGTATGLSSVARQIGAALGVAVVIAILGRPNPGDVHQLFRHAWEFAAACMFAAGLGCSLVGRLDLTQTPSLGAAARMALGRIPPPLVAPSERPRARRAVAAVTDRHDSARPQSAAEFLAQVPLLRGLDSAARDALAEDALPVRVEAGEWLFRQGEEADAMYLVQAGRMEVVAEPSGQLLRQLGRGDVVGELALLTDSPRSASVRAARSSELLMIRRGDFEQLLGASPATSLALSRSLAEQLRDTHAPISRDRPRPATVALVALDEAVPVADLSRRLAEQLRDAVSVAYVDAESAGAGSSPTAEDAAAVYGPVLDRLEASHDLVVLSAGVLPQPGPWLQFSLQQADRILVVADGSCDPARLEGRPELRGCDLVAYDVAPASGALSACATVLEPIECHALRRSELEADLARMGRRLSGRSVGIVLSGGGARAFAHLGVLEVLGQAGIRIDRVAGVSMGAFIGALFAMGLDLEEIDQRCFEFWVQQRPLADYTFPRHALIRGERMEGMLRRTFGEVAIEELALSFMCGMTELRRGDLVIARSGPLWEQVGFSLCLPIIAPPQVRGRELFVDGSLVDNLPVGTMAELGEGPIIAVDIKATLEGGREPRSGLNGTGGARPSERGAAGRSVRPPSLGETLARVLLLGSANTTEASRRHADLVISPRSPGLGLLEFHQIDAAREAGRVAAWAALENEPLSSPELKPAVAAT
ncbi:MAG TPA: MFS transporter [Solirubrobacteraceae bacterium]|nr:MFS transporter [Solirubrobacteraceae bacterium]